MHAFFSVEQKNELNYIRLGNCETKVCLKNIPEKKFIKFNKPFFTHIIVFSVGFVACNFLFERYDSYLIRYNNKYNRKN